MVGALARRLVCSPAAALGCVVIAHVLLSALFALTLPALESYDEPGHYAYIRFVGRAEAFAPPQRDFSIIFGDGQEDYVEMVGYLLPSPYAHKGGVMEVFAFWRALQPIPERYMLRLEGFSREGLSQL